MKLPIAASCGILDQEGNKKKKAPRAGLSRPLHWRRSVLNRQSQRDRMFGIRGDLKDKSAHSNPAQYQIMRPWRETRTRPKEIIPVQYATVTQRIDSYPIYIKITVIIELLFQNITYN